MYKGIVLLSAIICCIVSATNISLIWDSTSFPCKYKIYNGPSSKNYLQVIDVGSTNPINVNIVSYGTNYIAVTAYDDELESDFSNEIKVYLLPNITDAKYYISTNNLRQFSFSITDCIGVSYIIQASTNLASRIWEPIYTNTSPFVFVDTNAHKHPLRFYRLKRLDN